MNICDIAFSTEWFLTIPGMLITGGVVLLIIALIMLLVSSSKGKKKAVNSASTVPASEMNTNMPVQDNLAGVGVMPNLDMGNMPGVPPVAESIVAPQPTVDPVAPTLEVNEPNLNFAPANAMPEIPAMQMSGTETLDVVNPTQVVDSTSTMDSFQNPIPEVVPAVDVMSQPTNPIVENMPSVEPQPAVNPTPIVDIPVIEPVAMIDPTVSSIPSIEVVPTETIPVQNVPTVDSVQVPNNQNNVGITENPYAGPAQEEARPIYGGANPLDATQNLPKIDVHHEPYSGGREIASEPVQPNNVIPAVDSIPSIPVVESIPATEVPMSQTTAPMGNVTSSEPVTPVVPPIVEPTQTAPTQPTMVTPSYSAVQPTSPVVDVEQL